MRSNCRATSLKLICDCLCCPPASAASIAPLRSAADANAPRSINEEAQAAAAGVASSSVSIAEESAKTLVADLQPQQQEQPQPIAPLSPAEMHSGSAAEEIREDTPPLSPAVLQMGTTAEDAAASDGVEAPPPPQPAASSSSNVEKEILED